MIEITGRHGESIVLRGEFLIMFSNFGAKEVQRCLASSYVGTETKPIHQKGGAPKNYELTITCSTAFSLKMPASERKHLDRLVDKLELASFSI